MADIDPVLQQIASSQEQTEFMRQITQAQQEGRLKPQDAFKAIDQSPLALAMRQRGLNPGDYTIENGVLKELGWLARHGSDIAKGVAYGGGAIIGGAALMPALVGGGAAGGSAAVGTGAATGTGAAAGGGGIASIGGTGAIIGKGADIVSKLGRPAAAGAASAADARLLEGRFNQGQDALSQSAARGNIDADSARMRQAMLMSLLSGAEDSNVTAPSHIASRVGNVSGGLRPSALAGRQDIASAIRPRLMQNLMTGNEIPGPTAAPSPGFMDKLNSGLGTAGGYLGFRRWREGTA